MGKAFPDGVTQTLAFSFWPGLWGRRVGSKPSGEALSSKSEAPRVNPFQLVYLLLSRVYIVFSHNNPATEITH